jgi:hypothetical protein
MESSVPERDLPRGDRAEASVAQSWLEEIAVHLESDPEECWQALEGLAKVEAEVRLAIIAELSALRRQPGAERLIRLLSSARDPATREAARAALNRADMAARDRPDSTVPQLTDPERAAAEDSRISVDDERSILLLAASSGRAPRLARSLVTPVDGQGLASIIVSVTKREQRRTAAFLCDVCSGIRDVVGDVEPESPRAGGLVDQLDLRPESGCVIDVPELALGLLAGSLMLCRGAVARPVRDWLNGTLGPEFQPAGLPATITEVDASTIPSGEMPERAAKVLDACPSWLDDSPLTFDLAEEIWLREGKTAADPDRDAGAYRYLFEHRLIHRLELYRPMLLWMAWLWKFSSELELAQSAQALACQLSDEQYAVPSHPFTVALTTRSLKAAQSKLESRASMRG